MASQIQGALAFGGLFVLNSLKFIGSIYAMAVSLNIRENINNVVDFIIKSFEYGKILSHMGKTGFGA